MVDQVDIVDGVRYNIGSSAQTLGEEKEQPIELIAGSSKKIHCSGFCTLPVGEKNLKDR